MVQLLTTEEVRILQLLRHGDHHAFAQIYNQYWKTLLQMAWNHTKDQSLAEDILHEVFLKLWDNRRNYEIINIASFLATAVKFAVFNHYRKEKNRTELLHSSYRIDQFLDGDAEINRVFLSQYIAGIVEKMPDKCRLVFQYSRHEGLKSAEIAARMGISVKGVEANLTRAIKILKLNMKQDGLYILFAVELVDQWLA